MSIVKKIQGKTTEGMDDADDGSPGPHVTGPEDAQNESADAADAIFQAAERLVGHIDRRANAGNPELANRLKQIHFALSDMCARVEGVE